MKNTKTEVKEEIKSYKTLYDEIRFIVDGIKEGKQFLKEKLNEKAELTRDCSIMARELFTSKLAHKNDLTNFEKQVAVFLLNGEPGEEALESKFRVLQQLLLVRRHIIDVLGEIKEETEGEFKKEK